MLEATEAMEDKNSRRADTTGGSWSYGLSYPR